MYELSNSLHFHLYQSLLLRGCFRSLYGLFEDLAGLIGPH